MFLSNMFISYLVFTTSFAHILCINWIYNISLHFKFTDLEFAHKKYILMRDGSRWDDPNPSNNKNQQQSKEDLSDPRHPLNNLNLITEVHFVGRKATNQPIIDLSNLLMNRDHFGSITELWLNNNLISDEGAEAIASFLELPSCALNELWLGDNNIGASGTTLISAALSNNIVSKLKCLGLYKNKIGNGGALSLAQMLRKNNTLSTLDIHGCGNRGSGGQEGVVKIVPSKVISEGHLPVMKRLKCLLSSQLPRHGNLGDMSMSCHVVQGVPNRPALA